MRFPPAIVVTVASQDVITEEFWRAMKSPAAWAAGKPPK